MPCKEEEFNVGDIVTVIDFQRNWVYFLTWLEAFAPEYYTSEFLDRWYNNKRRIATPELNGDIGEVIATSKKSLGAEMSASLVDFGDSIRLIKNVGLKKVEHIIKVSQRLSMKARLRRLTSNLI